MEEMMVKSDAVAQVRTMAYQFADLYFMFVCKIREQFGEDTALDMAQRVIFERAKERALAMIDRAQTRGMDRCTQNISKLTDVPFLGWVDALGADKCPYGAQWNKRIEQNPWFRKFARLYCDVTDTTICEVFTGDHTQEIYQNVVLGDQACKRTYSECPQAALGQYTFDPDRRK